jgi:hypothetical protein
MAFDAPVVVPVNTSRDPAVVEMTLAVTPGLSVALLIAEAMPESVSSVESMEMEVEALPTVKVSVPVPTAVLPLATGAEVSVAAVARFCTSREYCPGTAVESVVAEAMVLSPTVAL